MMGGRQVNSRAYLSRFNFSGSEQNKKYIEARSILDVSLEQSLTCSALGTVEFLKFLKFSLFPILERLLTTHVLKQMIQE